MLQSDLKPTALEYLCFISLQCSETNTVCIGNTGCCALRKADFELKCGHSLLAMRQGFVQDIQD